MHVAIIGAGAAGCFAAINLKRLNPSVDVTVYESGNRPLAKVSVTGGGRCNLTNSFDGIKSLSAVYPRGERLMKRLLHEFSNKDTCEWFEREGVRLITQDDYCVFPQSQDAMEIVDTLINLMNKNKIKICTGHRVDNIEK
ncbi:MAG TPA: FAD-dependent oxidoreductase, partial [Xylanibacter oryzae]|nr:FAD-dependent oxidoreductase [Xylanibacter oryzae]